MSEAVIPAAAAAPRTRTPTDWKTDAMQSRIRGRYRAERRFRLLGLLAVLLSAGFLAFLLVTMLGNGLRGFTQTEVQLDIDFPRSTLIVDPATLQGFGADAALATADVEGAMRTAAERKYGDAAAGLFSDAAWIRVRDRIKEEPGILNRTETFWLPASDALDVAAKSEGDAAAEALHRQLDEAGVVRTGFNRSFLTGSDATDPTVVGIWGAFKGSLLTMLVTLALAFPIGVLSAVYLEEYAPRNRWTDLIEV